MCAESKNPSGERQLADHGGARVHEPVVAFRSRDAAANPLTGLVFQIDDGLHAARKLRPFSNPSKRAPPAAASTLQRFNRARNACVGNRLPGHSVRTMLIC